MFRGVLVTAAVLLASCGQPAEEPQTGVTESEHAYGEEQHPRLLAEFGGAYGDHQAAYVQRVGDRVAASADLDGACTFTLVNSDVVNAFAVPGCYIYITRGLFAIVNSEAELASVLGHEIGHIVGQHSQRQERRSLWRSLGVVAAGWTGSERLTRLAGQAAQYFTQRYSRSQEYEADELGVRYLQDAGYDVFATAEMLGALGHNETFTARTRGQGDARSIPEWALSHPLTQHRVDHATDIAVKTGVANDALPENEAAYLQEVDGLLYGDDPEQGFVIGQQFAHPMMRIGFEAPPGFSLTNSPQAIRLSGPNGVRGEFGGGRLPPNGIEAYAEALAANVAANAPATLVSARRRTVNGLSAAMVTVAIQSANGPVPLSIAAYDGGDGAAYHFVAIAPAGRDNQAALDRLFDSFHHLSDDQVARLRPRVIRSIPVRAGDTIADLASRTDDPAPQELFMMLNGLAPDQRRPPTGTVKIVTYRPVARPRPRRSM
jgi:predicted Zn-dependent protease